MIVRRIRWLLSTTILCLKKALPFASALGPSSPTDQAASKAAQSTKILQEFQKLQNDANSTNSLINSKKSEFRTSTTKPEFNPNSIQSKPKTLSELEEDLKELLEDSKKETSMNGKTTLFNCIRVSEPSFRKKKSRTSFKKTTRKKKLLKNTFSNIDDIDDKIEHCLQKAKDILSINTTLGESSTQWTLNSAELEQDQVFIKYLEQLDEPIPEDELADWSHDIDLFMEGLNNPDKLETLWKQSKAKKL